MSKLVPTTEAAFVPDAMAQLPESSIDSDFPVVTEDDGLLAEVAREADVSLRESERHFHKLLEKLPAAVYTTDAEGRITYCNEAAATLWGCRPELGKNRWCGSWKLFWPDGTPLPHDECPMALAVKQQIPVRGLEAIAERPDGSRVPFMPYPTPLFDAAGALVGAINMLVDLTGRKHAEAALRASEALLSTELEATQHLQAVSLELVREQDPDILYNKLVEAAAHIMRSDCASLQMLYPERGKSGELRLLAYRGFDPESAKFWEWVRADSGCTCGQALRTRKRAIAADVETCDFMSGTPDRTAYLQAGMRAAQSTPLISRSGQLLGMISTHWRQPHDPAEGDLRRLDILARQAADLVERVQTEAALRASEARLSAIIKQVSAGLAETDLSGRFQLVNQRYCGMLGYSEAELAGMRMQDITHPDDLPANMALFEKLVQTGESFTIEKRYCRKGGSIIWVSNSVSAIKDAHGEIVNVVAVSLDITERKRAEEISQRYVAIVESSDDAILSKDLNGIIISCNPGGERLFGYSAAELIGKPATVLISPEYRHEEPYILERIRRGESIDHYETVRRRKDGSLIDISLTVSPIRDAKGKIVGASKIARDITARKRAEEQRTLLLREMNHRVKNLFAVTSGVVTLSADSAQTPRDLARNVRGRLDALARAHELVLPNVSDAGLPARQSSTLDVLLQTVLCPYTDAAGRGHDCIVADGPAVKISPGAAGSLALVLHELATNAVKYGALSVPQGRVHAHWSIENGELSLTWTERDGPPVKGPPAEEGFGSRLTGRSASQLGGRLTRDWTPDGLIVRLSVPVDRLAS
ncbi:MAG TPA: PAS domain S-box protein [Pseudolabrys sp.]|nr:PAS domain S-box protein [Pseudolabrys sp.]